MNSKIFAISVRNALGGDFCLLVESLDYNEVLKFFEKWERGRGGVYSIEKIECLGSLDQAIEVDRVCKSCRHWQYVYPETGTNFSRGICENGSYKYIKGDNTWGYVWLQDMYFMIKGENDKELDENIDGERQMYTASTFGCKNFGYKRKKSSE